MKDLKDWAAVHRVYKIKKSIRKTAKELNMSKNTVRRLLKMKEPPVYKRKKSSTIIDIYKDQIIEWRCVPYEFNGTRIFRELQIRGYTGSLGTVYRYLRALDESENGRISSKATVRHESPPGDQAQFDWSEYDVLIGGVYYRVYCFSLILAASRKKSICFSLREDAHAIYEAIQELFDDLGGVTLELLIDNPKALVIKNDPKSQEEITYNPHALMIAKHLGTELNACPCFWPRKKGKVEASFRYIEEQFIKGSSFESMEELNRRGKEFVNKWCDCVHTTTGRIPNQHYQLEEQALLQPLPKEHLYFSSLKKRTVSPDSYVSIDTNKYSVPVQYVDKEVNYRIDYGFRIKIYDSKNNLILTTEAYRSKKNTKSVDEHYEAIRQKTATSVPQLKRDFTSMFSNGEKYLEAAYKVFEQPAFHIRKIMELVDFIDESLVDYFIGKAVKENKLSIKEFKAMLKEHSSETAKLNNEDNASASLTRECSYYEGLGKEVKQ